MDGSPGADGLIIRYEFDPLTSILNPTQGSLVELDLTCSPNPVSQTAQVAFTLKQSGSVNVEIWNSQGALQETLYRGNLDRGDHNFAWQTDALTPGVYHCRVVTEGGADIISVVKSN